MTLRPLIDGNWKMNGTPSFGKDLAAELTEGFNLPNVEMAVFPSFTSLTTVHNIIDESPIALGAQNVHAEANGAHTGEVSAEMLKECGCKYVILGHSERREAGETDADVADKTCAALAEGLVPVVCIGEKAKMDPAEAQDILTTQLHGSLKNIAITDGDQIVIAYEPVWAIGTGKTATPEIAQAMHAFIRSVLADKAPELGEKCAILYGGSVNASTAPQLFAQPDIDGGLVGGASLKADEFMTICESI